MHPVIAGFVLVAAAEPVVSPTRRCADAAKGTEVEVCLRLAVEHPEAVEGIVGALLAHVDRTEAPDRALLQAMLMLQSDKAPEGSRLLGSLADPRVVPVLLHGARSADAATAVACVRALSAHQAAWPTMAGWLDDRSLPLEVRVAIARAFGQAQHPDAEIALADAIRRRLPPALRQEIALTLAEAYPASVPPVLPPETDGSAWLAMAAAGSLAYTMGTAAHLGRNGDWVFGAATGAVGGASAGWLYGRAWPMEGGTAARMATFGAGGTAAGLFLGAALADAPFDSQVPLLAGLGGQVTGIVTGFVLDDAGEPTPGDAVEAALFASLVAVAIDRTGAFVASEVDGYNVGPTGVAVVGGLVAGQFVAPAFELRRDVGWLAMGTSLGLATGLLLPIGESPRATLPLATAATGAAVGAVLAGPFGARGDLFVGATAGVLSATTLGVGSGMLLWPERPDVARGMGLGGIFLGLGVGSVVARYDTEPVDDRDVALAAAAAAWGGWNALAIASLTDHLDQQGVGGVLVGASTAGSVALGLNLALDVPVTHTLTASSIGLWGGYAGAAVAQALDISPYVLALPASNVGVATGALLVSRYVGVPPVVIGVADAGGVFGAALTAVGAGLLSDDPDVVALTTLGGAVVGAGFGVVIGTHWHRSGTRDSAFLPRRDLGRSATVVLAPLVVPEGSGIVAQVTGW